MTLRDAIQAEIDDLMEHYHADEHTLVNAGVQACRLMSMLRDTETAEADLSDSNESLAQDDQGSSKAERDRLAEIGRLVEVLAEFPGFAVWKRDVNDDDKQYHAERRGQLILSLTLLDALRALEAQTNATR